MTAHDSLLRDVCERPFADEPRLVYADWLDENGQPERAEFIRVQIELANGADLNPNWVSRAEELWYAPAMGFVPPAEWKDWTYTVGDHMPGSTRTSAIVSRGFPSSIACSLAAFMGGEPCQHCDNGGVDTGAFTPWDSPITIMCMGCKGSGRIPGLVETLGRQWPITSVTLTDREPYTAGSEFSWYDETTTQSEGIHLQSNLPKEIFDRLPYGGVGGLRYGRWFKSNAAAMAALSKACVDMMRERAGLPAMRW